MQHLKRVGLLDRLKQRVARNGAGAEEVLDMSIFADGRFLETI